MFTNLELFLQDKEVYKKTIAELQQTISDEEELNRKIADAKEKFKGQVRRYLPAALDVIKTSFSCQYSIYKVGKDFDANFHVVETNVRKTKQEVLKEMEEFKRQSQSMSLDNQQINKINTAMDVLLTYSEDALDSTDENKEEYLKNAKVVASSIVETPTRNHNAFTPAPADVVPNYNPYANQPITMDESFQQPSYNRQTLVDPFASLYNNTEVSPPTSQVPEQNMGFINSQPNYQEEKFRSDDYNVDGSVHQNVEPENNIEAQNVFGMYSSNTGVMRQENSYTNSNPVSTSYSMPNSYQPGYENQKNIQEAPNYLMGAGMSISNTSSYAHEEQGTFLNSTPNRVNYQNSYSKMKAYTLWKILTGVLLLPLLSIVVTMSLYYIFKAMVSANIFEKLIDLVDILEVSYIEVFIGFVIELIATTIVLVVVDKKANHAGKFGVMTTTLFTGILWSTPYIIERIPTESISFLEEVFVYLSMFLFVGFTMAVMYLFRSFFVKNKNGKWNIVEMISLLWLIYALFIPTYLMLASTIGIDFLVEELYPLYDYTNAEILLIAVSYVLSGIMLVTGQLECKK